MILWTRVSVASLFAAAAIAATGLAWRASSKTCPLPTPPAAIPQVDPAPAVAASDDDPTPEAVAAGDDDAVDSPDDTDVAAVGDVDVTRLPAPYARQLTPAQTSNLTAFVNGWLTGGQAPAIEYRRGVVRVHSDEDRGDNPPYPRSASASGERICGEPAVWLRDALRARLPRLGLTCSQNVCSYGGAEYAPTGYVFFRPVTIDDQQLWALDAWVEISEAALPTEVSLMNRAEVVRLMKRVASTSCAGEPAGAY
jgi:hypothetical protein